MSDVPKNVSWDPYNLCYLGNCPYCGEPTRFQRYDNPHMRNAPCDKCGKTLNVRPWMKIKYNFI